MNIFILSKYILFFLLFCSLSYSQKFVKLTGKVSYNDKPVAESLIEIRTKDSSKLAVSNENGFYSFFKINCNQFSDLTISVNRIGYKSYNSNIKIANDSIIAFNVVLEKEGNTNTLDEVIINTKLKTVNTVGKSVYKIDKNKFIANATAFDALGSLPNIYCNKQTGDIIVEGKLDAKLFIDGIESKYSDYKSLKIIEIDKIEIINNPTSVYGTDFLGAVINIKTKKINNSFYHGFIRSSVGLLNYQNSLYSNIKYKIKSFYINSDFGYVKSNQISKTFLNRTDQNGSLIQNATNESKNIQPYLNTKIGITFSKKTDLTISQYFGGYSIEGENKGTLISNNNLVDYKNISKTENKDFEVASVLKYVINQNKTLFFKNRLTNINDYYKATYVDANINFFDINSKKNELLLNLNYNIENVNKYFNVITYDLRYTIRKFDYTYTDFYLNQNILDATIETSNKWTEKFSTQTSLTFEYLSNQNNTSQKNQTLILPTFNSIYHFEKNIDLSAGFSTKII